MSQWQPPTAPGAGEQNMRTPPALFRELERRFGRGKFTLDAAASATDALCDLYFTEEQDALKQTWSGRVFCNPPYQDILPWVKHAHCAVVEDHAEVVVMLLPARTGTEWYDFCLRNGTRIEPIRGRVAFLNPEGRQKKGNFEWSLVVVFERPILASKFR